MPPETTTGKLLSSPSSEYLKKSPSPIKLKPKPPTFWVLFLSGLALFLLAAALAVSHFLSTPKSVPPPTDKKIPIPYANQPEIWKPFRQWVIQEDGRNKPFETFSREVVRTVTGREKFEGVDAVPIVVSWMLNTANDPWEEHAFIRCDHHELRRTLYQEHRKGKSLTELNQHGKYIEPMVLRHSKSFQKILKEARRKRMVNRKAVLTGLEQRAREVEERFDLYERIRKGGQDARAQERFQGSFTIVALDDHSPAWYSIRAVREFLKDDKMWEQSLRARRLEHPSHYRSTDKQDYPEEHLRKVATAMSALHRAYQSEESSQFAKASQEFFTTLDRVSKSHAEYPATSTTSLELWFNRVNPFRKAWIFTLLASLLLLTSLTVQKWSHITRWAGLGVYVWALVWSVIGFYCRVRISGRPPVSNMYESIIWVGFMTGVIAFVLEMIFRKGVIALAGGVVSMFGLILADQLPLVFKPDIQPLQAVLRSNYWLIIHVLTIVSSYSAFALAWGLGNINLGLMLLAPHRRDLIKTLSHFCYRAIQIGVVLLAAGTLLGGFWAAESWGRFWGWDPKEVWALIALLFYVIPLHARYVGWVKDFGLAICSVVCFSSVVMAWYGVNYILGAGLHSYGFGSGNDFWVYWAGLFNIALVMLAASRNLARSQIRMQSDTTTECSPHQ